MECTAHTFNLAFTLWNVQRNVSNWQHIEYNTLSHSLTHTHTHTPNVNQNLTHSISVIKIYGHIFLYFEGFNCETNVDDCQSNQCENNGTCVDSLEDYYCNCQAGFEGKVISVSNSWALAVFKYGMRRSSTEELLKIIMCKKNCT